MRFDTASITKLFTSVATLQLIDQGLLSFDTSVIDFLGLKDTAISPDVNVFHLLTHTSGIGDDAEEEAGEDYEDLWKIQAQLLRNRDRRLSAPVHPQAAQLRAGPRLPLLQLQLHPAGSRDRADHGIELSRLRAPQHLRPGRHGRHRLPAHGSCPRKRSRRRRPDPGRRRATSSPGRRTSTPTRPSARPMPVRWSPPPTWIASCALFRPASCSRPN